MGSQNDIPVDGAGRAPGGPVRWLIAAWAVGLVVVYAMGGVLGVRQLQGYKSQTEAARQEHLQAVTADANAVASTAGSATRDSRVDVSAGIYVRRIGGFSLREAQWTADFDIWFGWSGEPLRPGETFEIVNGDIQRREKIDSFVRNGMNYERYRVTARMTKHFDPSRFPFADEALTIEIQDVPSKAATIRYVADEEGSGLEEDALPQNVRLRRTMLIATAHRMGPGAGHSGGDGMVVSRLIHATLVEPRSVGVYWRVFRALFAAVAVAMIVFFIRPAYVDARFGLPVGAFFAAVANNVFVGTILPYSDRITLADMVNLVGLVTLFLILVQSAASLCIQDRWGLDRSSRMFDRISFAVMLPCYVGLNLLLPWVATPS